MESTTDMTFDWTGASAALPGSRYRAIRTVEGRRGSECVVEDLGEGGRRRVIRTLPDLPPIRAAAETARRVSHDQVRAEIARRLATLSDPARDAETRPEAAEWLARLLPPGTEGQINAVHERDRLRGMLDGTESDGPVEHGPPRR
jgi:hypothetical protein